MVLLDCLFVRSLKAEGMDKITTLEFLQAIGQLKFRGTSVLLRSQPSVKRILRTLPYDQHKDKLQNRQGFFKFI